MDVNLLELLKQVLGSDFARLASQYLGEPEQSTQTSLDALLPAILGTVSQKGATLDGAQSLLSLLQGLGIDTGTLNNIAGLFSGEAAGANSLVNNGLSLVNSLFGDKTNSLTDALSSLGGLNSGASSKLLALAVPLVLAFLKRFIGEKGLDLSSLTSLFAGQGDFLKGALDSRLTNALGFPSPAALLGGLAGPAAAAATPPPVYTEPVQKSRLPWLLIGLGLLGALLLWQFLSRPATPPPAVKAPAPVKAVVVECGFPAKIYFEVGQAVIGPEGLVKIKEAAACIKEKGLKVDITGYTDKTGDPAVNLELAKNRAQAVQDALVAAGLAVDAITLKPPLFHAVAGATGTGTDAEARRVEINKAVIVRLP